MTITMISTRIWTRARSSSSSDFTPLSGQAADLSGEEGETVEDVEEFFDEEDAEDEEPPVTEE